MAIPRYQLVDGENPLFYHLISRCVRRAWLCGLDQTTGRDYTYRKRSLEQRLIRLAQSFAVEIYAYAVMSNHFHLVVRYDPGAAARWSDEEVVERWLKAFPARRGADPAGRREQLLAQPARIGEARTYLGSLSRFMQCLKQPIARQANLEDGTTGHFFEQRFYSGALLTEEAVLAAMAYVDLNPVRANIDHYLSKEVTTSLARRLSEIESTPERVDAYLGPVISGLENPTPCGGDVARCSRQQPGPVQKKAGPSLHLRAYIQQLRVAATLLKQERKNRGGGAAYSLWFERVRSIGTQRRAYGGDYEMSQWAKARGWRGLDPPFP